MTVDKLPGGKLLIRLSPDDMKDFGMDFTAVSFDDGRCEKIITGLTRLACIKAGLALRGRRVYAEAFMLGSECCILVTAEKRRYKIKKFASVCWRMENAEDFLAAVEALFRRRVCCKKCSAYELSGRYYLVFDYPSLPKSIAAALCEFGGRLKGAYTAQRIRENANEICKTDAIALIGQKLV